VSPRAPRSTKPPPSTAIRPSRPTLASNPTCGWRRTLPKPVPAATSSRTICIVATRGLVQLGSRSRASRFVGAIPGCSRLREQDCAFDASEREAVSQVCVYCVQNEADTEDHVVPEGLFEHAPETGYIRVPACYTCNNGLSRDEEYFLVAILAEATAHSATANRVLDRLAEDHRSGRRRRTGLALALLEKARPVDVYSPGGIYLGTAEGLELDTTRVNRVLDKIVRGLFFHHVGRRLSQDAAVYVEIKPDLDRMQSPVIAAALAQAPTFLGDVFMYRLFSPSDGTDATSWTLGFYDAVLAIGVTGRPRNSEVM